jgi:hypothetical protein
MAEVAVIAANVAGDVGQTGISRMHFIRQDLATIQPADLNSAAAAMRTFWVAAASYFANDITWSWQSSVPIIESTSALIQRYMAITSLPATVLGSATGNYAGGNGARVVWHTTTISTRKLMRASNYMVPMAGPAFTALGGLAPVVATTLQSAAVTFLNSLNSSGIALISYHRPVKGATSGGKFGIVTNATVSTTVSSLRSRRS